MDALSIFIIIIATATAIAFKVFLFKRIRQWADQDLIKSLAEKDAQKLEYLQNHYNKLLADKTPRKELHDKLTELAENFSAE